MSHMHCVYWGSRQEPGTRLKHPLSYKFDVVDTYANGSITLTIAHLGNVEATAGVFNVYDRKSPLAAPRKFVYIFVLVCALIVHLCSTLAYHKTMVMVIVVVVVVMVIVVIVVVVVVIVECAVRCRTTRQW